eukprot:2314972-Pleurochrysis_carterae.AAC.2
MLQSGLPFIGSPGSPHLIQSQLPGEGGDSRCHLFAQELVLTMFRSAGRCLFTFLQRPSHQLHASLAVSEAFTGCNECLALNLG